MRRKKMIKKYVVESAHGVSREKQLGPISATFIKSLVDDEIFFSKKALLGSEQIRETIVRKRAKLC